MKLFPKEKIVLTTALSQDSVLEKISKNIKVERDFKTFSLAKGDKGYEGTVFSNSFRINRVLTYRNSFLPITFGNIHRSALGSDINLTIKMEKFQFIIFVVWTIFLGGISICSLFILLTELFYSGQFEFWTLFAPTMFLIGYLYAIINFKKEMISTKTFLIRLVDAKET